MYIKTSITGLVTCLAILFFSIGTASGQDISQDDEIIQPQGIDRVGVYDLRQMNPSLTGAGVNFALVCRSFTYVDGEPQNDYRPNISHNCFNKDRFGFIDQTESPSGISPHSTAVCSILFGEDPDAYNPQLGRFYYQGVSPQSRVDVYEFWNFLINNVTNFTPPDADILTADFGYPFEEWWTRGIESLAEHYGLIVVSGIGNGSNSYDPVLYPGAGSNVIGVGVVDSVNSDDPAVSLAQFSLANPEHSSTGPTANGRCKPDIIAPGNCLAADANEPDKYEPTGNWSSFSTPIVAGTIGLLVQKAKQLPALQSAISPDGSNCVIKAILLNSATKLPYWHKGKLQTDDDHTSPLDYIQGAGMLNAVDAYKTLTAGQYKPGDAAAPGWDLRTLDKNTTPDNTYRITVDEPADKFVAVTLVWNRHYSDYYPFEPMPEKDGDLKLEIWAVDPADQSNNYLLDYSDSSIDNLEHIYVAADPGYINYEIIVTYSDVNTKNSSSQNYGIAWGVKERKDDDNISWYDLYADGIVDESDYSVLMKNSLADSRTTENYLVGDINSDGVIDTKDLNELASHNNRRADWRVE